ncbi:MAG: hypothetical protein NTW78_01355 [Campylobacterales bacterium]|nr:hypothetical protein [Campylobacterales bacterium]
MKKLLTVWILSLITLVTVVYANNIIIGSTTTCPAAVDGTITATADCTISSAEMNTSLEADNLTVNTGGLGNITVISPISFSSAHKLTLNSGGYIDIAADITALNANGKVALFYGQAAVASDNNASYTLNGGKINLQAGQNFSTKLGSDGAVTTWTVITSLGSAGSTTNIDLQGVIGTLSGKFVLGSDINASSTTSWDSNGSGGYYGFTPIGNSSVAFTGLFDGLGHTIDGLYINRPATDYIGFLGDAGNGSIIKNIALTNINVSGRGLTGGLIGYSDGAGVLSSYATGTVNGSVSHIGGLVGLDNNGTILNSHFDGIVNAGAADNVGGLTSRNNYGVISNSYSTGSVIGHDNTGGFIGLNYGGVISNSYTHASVNGNSYVGGFVGYNDAATIINSYTTGHVIGITNTGGFMGTVGSGNIINCFWDIDTSGQTGNVGTGIYSSTSAINAYTQATYTGWDFTNIWYMADGYTRPMLRSEASATITNAHQLQLINANLSGTYALVNDINLSTPLADTKDVWKVNSGFVPIGYTPTAYDGYNPILNISSAPFTGVFDGSFHTVSNLVINKPTSNFLGLFSAVGSGSYIRNIGLIGANVNGNAVVGSLVGYNAGTVTSSYASAGSVSGGSYANNIFGGLVGYNGGTVTSSYSTVPVTVGSGTAAVAGLVGLNRGGTILNSYSTGLINGIGSGLTNEGTVTNSFWDIQTSGQTTSAGGIGKTTAQLQTLSTFTTAGWDISATSTPSSNPYPNLSMGGATIWTLHDTTIYASGASTIGTSGNDIIVPSPDTNQSIDGGDGNDAVVLPNAKSTYTVTKIDNTHYILTDATKTYNLTNIEFLSFADVQNVDITAPFHLSPTISHVYDRFRAPFQYSETDSLIVSFDVNDTDSATLTLTVIADNNNTLNTANFPLNSSVSANQTQSINIVPISVASMGNTRIIIILSDGTTTVYKSFNVNLSHEFDVIAMKEANISNINFNGDYNGTLYTVNSYFDNNVTVEYEKLKIINSLFNSNLTVIKDINGTATVTTETNTMPKPFQYADTNLSSGDLTAAYNTYGTPFEFFDENSSGTKVYVTYPDALLESYARDMRDQNGSFFTSINSFMSATVQGSATQGIRNHARNKLLVFNQNEVANSSGTLIELSENGDLFTTNAGTWEKKTVNAQNILLIHPTSKNGYDTDMAFALDGGIVKSATYKASGDIYSYILLNKVAKDELYHSLSSNPKIATHLNNGYTYISLPSSKTLCDADVQNVIDSCDKNNTLESIFGVNSHVDLVFKFGREWMYWNSDVNASPSFSMQKFSAINPLEGIMVKTTIDTNETNGTTIYLPFDEDSEVVNDYTNMFATGWTLMSNNKVQTVGEISTALAAENKKLVYILVLRGNTWYVYAPTNNSAVSSSIPRLNSINRYESYWVYFIPKDN